MLLRRAGEALEVGPTPGGCVIDGLAGAGGMGKPSTGRGGEENLTYDQAHSVIRGFVDAEEDDLKQAGGKPGSSHMVVAIGGLVVYAVLIYWMLNNDTLRARGAYG